MKVQDCMNSTERESLPRWLRPVAMSGAKNELEAVGSASQRGLSESPRYHLSLQSSEIDIKLKNV